LPGWPRQPPAGPRRTGPPCWLIFSAAGFGLPPTTASSKPNALSPGCRLCGQGEWSCLFVNIICNAHCFSCPTSQRAKDEPTTNNLRFPKPGDYIRYLEKFRLKGAGFSGGEPLMTADRTINYLRLVKEHFGAAMHLWMYTNGILLTGDILKRLRKSGLDEIRFDISADNYRLDKVAMAVGQIPTVTVEIPAVPEDFTRLAETMRELDRLGVDFLNLHQLRLTPHNRQNLMSRNYTFLHGPKVVVLESELTALRLLEFAMRNRLRLAVNYCSYIHKHRYQAMGVRKRSAPFICKPYEDVTAAGLIRTLAVRGEPAVLHGLVADFQAAGQDGETWQLNSRGDVLCVAAPLLDLLRPGLHRLTASYHVASLKSAVTYRDSYRVITLSAQRKLIVERSPVAPDLAVPPERLQLFTQSIRPGNNDAPWPASGDSDGTLTDWEKIGGWERLGSGLEGYY